MMKYYIKKKATRRKNKTNFRTFFVEDALWQPFIERLRQDRRYTKPNDWMIHSIQMYLRKTEEFYKRSNR
jgi:hypothetical protein